MRSPRELLLSSLLLGFAAGSPAQPAIEVTPDGVVRDKSAALPQPIQEIVTGVKAAVGATLQELQALTPQSPSAASAPSSSTPVAPRAQAPASAATSGTAHEPDLKAELEAMRARVEALSKQIEQQKASTATPSVTPDSQAGDKPRTAAEQQRLQREARVQAPEDQKLDVQIKAQEEAKRPAEAKAESEAKADAVRQPAALKHERQEAAQRVSQDKPAEAKQGAVPGADSRAVTRPDASVSGRQQTASAVVEAQGTASAKLRYPAFGILGELAGTSWAWNSKSQGLQQVTYDWAVPGETLRMRWADRVEYSLFQPGPRTGELVVTTVSGNGKVAKRDAIVGPDGAIATPLEVPGTLEIRTVIRFSPTGDLVDYTTSRLRNSTENWSNEWVSTIWKLVNGKPPVKPLLDPEAWGLYADLAGRSTWSADASWGIAHSANQDGTAIYSVADSPRMLQVIKRSGGALYRLRRTRDKEHVDRGEVQEDGSYAWLSGVAGPSDSVEQETADGERLRSRLIWSDGKILLDQTFDISTAPVDIQSSDAVRRELAQMDSDFDQIIARGVAAWQAAEQRDAERRARAARSREFDAALGAVYGALRQANAAADVRLAQSNAELNQTLDRIRAQASAQRLAREQREQATRTAFAAQVQASALAQRAPELASAPVDRVASAGSRTELREPARTTTPPLASVSGTSRQDGATKQAILTFLIRVSLEYRKGDTNNSNCWVLVSVPGPEGFLESNDTTPVKTIIDSYKPRALQQCRTLDRRVKGEPDVGSVDDSPLKLGQARAQYDRQAGQNAQYRFEIH